MGGKNKIRAFLAIGVALAAALGPWSSLSLSAREYFVDAAAAPGGDGSSAKPFATPVAARDAVRADRKAGRLAATESAVITFAPGDYPQLKPFELTPEDSGSGDYAPVVYRAAQPRTVRFTGGVGLKAKDFVPVTDPALLARLPEAARAKARVADVAKIITAELPDLPREFTGAPPPPLVFMRGSVVESARWPNAGEYAKFFTKDKVDDLAFTFDNPRAKRWKLENGLWLCGYWTHDWFQNVVKVDHFGPEEVAGPGGKKVRRANVIRFDKMDHYGVLIEKTSGGRGFRRFYATNLFDELDNPGEWFYDRKGKKLYVIPPDGEEVRDADDILLAVNDDVLVRVAEGVRYVRFENLDFTGAAKDLVSVLMTDAVIDGCRFSCCGKTALTVGGAARRVRVANCEVTKIGGAGIVVSAGDGKTLARGDVVVENCRIHSFAQINRTYNAGITARGVGNTFRKCEVYDAPHMALRCGGQLNVFEYNNIHHVLLETADAGAFYNGRSLTAQGNVLRWNYFHDLGRANGSCVAIYFDDCGCGTAAYGNIIHKAGLAFLIGGGRDHPIRGNIISSCLSGISMRSRGMAWPSFNDPHYAEKQPGKSQSWMLYDRAVKAVDFETGIWRDRFPRLADVMNDDWAMPYYNPVENNIFIDVTKSILTLSEGEHFKADRMAPITGNLIVSTVGSTNVATAVPAVAAKGFTTLVGTPEKPIGVGVDSRAAGDFRFLPGSAVLRACPGFDVIPFDEIPNASGERPLIDYASLVKTVDGKQVWTAALQKALDENERVRIPASAATYWIDAPVIVRSHRRINAHGATISLLKGCDTLMLRNAAARDGEVAPIPADAPRDADIAISGGTWCDWRDARAGYGASGRFNRGKRELGNFYGVSALFYFGCVDRLSLTSVTFRNCSAFAVQCGDATDLSFRHIRFEGCFADGLHLNGNLSHVRGRDIKGSVGDDLVALNACDWLKSSVNFGPQTDIVFEDLELVRPKKGASYRAIRLLPAVYRYPDGREVDCAISNVVFRKVRGIRNFKMYAQTPPCPIGEPREWYKVGNGGDILFEDVAIDFTGPVDAWPMGDYAKQDPVRGHIAPFEIGANLSKVTLKDVTVDFHCDKWGLSHLVLVGPKSCRWPARKRGGKTTEVFDPDLVCAVGEIVLDNVQVRGTAPAELVRATVFDNVNGDGHSSGRGVIRKLSVVPAAKPDGGVCPRHVLNNRRREATAAETKAAAEWRNGGRQKALDWFRENMYGRLPAALAKNPYGRPDDEKIGERSITCADGQVKINVHLSLPEGADAAHPVPVFVFFDHSWSRTSASKSDVYQGIPTNTITARGYAYVTWNGNNVAPNVYHKWGTPPNKDPSLVWSNGVFKVYGCGGPSDWGTIGAWAWGCSRVMDWIETRPELDAKRVAIVGHSRGGKTALWAGAQDERFALVISNDSGTGGARAQKGFHLKKAESLESMLNGRLYFWFCPKLRDWLGKEQQLPYDAPDLLKLVAPRLVYVASGSKDAWAGPEAEYASAVRASALWRGLGLKGMALTCPWKNVHPGMTDHSGSVGYHLRPGPHHLDPYDWDRFMDFADVHLKK